MNKIRSYDWSNGEVNMFPAESGGCEAVIKSFPMPEANKTREIRATAPRESFKLKADTPDALELKCMELIRKIEKLSDYEPIPGWRRTDTNKE